MNYRGEPVEAINRAIADALAANEFCEVEKIIRSFRRALDNDDLIEELLRNPSRVLREADSVERSDPKPLTH